MNEPFQAVIYLGLALYAAVLIHAAMSDLRRLEIPNVDSIILAVGFIPAALLAGVGAIDIAWAAGIAVGMLALGIFLFARGLFGGGHAKLLAAVVLWTAPADIPRLLAVMAILGGGLALAVLLARKLAPRAPILADVFPWLSNSEPHLPYGVAIAGAGLCMITRSPLLAALN